MLTDGRYASQKKLFEEDPLEYIGPDGFYDMMTPATKKQFNKRLQEEGLQTVEECKLQCF